MGTRADFYIGRGKDAEWLGSVAHDGYPDGVLRNGIGAATSEADFRAGVAGHLASLDHATRPEQGWPWPWEDSRTTDYAYAWDDGVWCCCFGSEWDTAAIALANDHEFARVKSATFPDMTARQNVTLGPRSGVIVLGIKREP